MPVGSNDLIGAPSIEKDATFGDSYAGNPYTLGQMVSAFDPYWGWLELVYVKWTTASTAVNPGRLVTINSSFVIVDNANTANLSLPVYVVASRFPSDASVSTTNPLFGWVVRSAGKFPVQASAAYTAGAAYFAAAGTITHVLTAGKQVNGMNGIIGSTGTITKTCQTVNASNELIVPNKEGLYVGLVPSGTGIAASTISSLDTGKNNTVRLSANMTATGTVTVTFTNTGFAICQFNSPCTQGNIT